MEQQSVDLVLNTFFAFSCAGKQTPTRARYLRVALQLRRYLEAEGARVLCAEDKALLALERSLEPEAAFARLFGAHELAYALSGFLEPEWLLPDLQDRRTQVALTPRLIQWLCNSCLLDPGRDRPAIRSARAAAAEARKGPARKGPARKGFAEEGPGPPGPALGGSPGG
ncbi:hypothetical protein LJ759_04470 [Arthrobacter sp. zg-Y1110]|uniref:hypothetical protein n=1 Tax=Arthrobacter sp. zg-Y1110 TaxID=2886932 RepID=UPI001D153E76|nr:hypothetical protein [Arthrobacter sp. zg-Y1110]MCC3290219.1 hypothetical protein [Arthrobacter sp. zg-Y1110]